MGGIRRFLALIPGNPMNPVTLLVLAFFAAALVGFPPFMVSVGLEAWDVVLVEVVVVATAVVCLGLVVWVARRYAGDYERLLAGEHWVRWRTTPNERARFVAQERARTRAEAKRYAVYAVGVAAIGGVAMWAATRTVTGAALGIAAFGVAGLLVVATTLRWGGARERPGALDLDDTLLGNLGISHLGRYTPLRGFNLFLEKVDLLPCAPAVLAFTVGSRTRYGTVRSSEVRVAVPPGGEAEAATLAERFRREFGLAS